MTAQYDIIIIGGGPAGTSTALHLAQLAPHLASRTLLLEKAHYPRPKLCAGGLTVDAEVILKRLGLDLEEVPCVRADSVHLQFAGKGLRMGNAHDLPGMGNAHDLPGMGNAHNLPGMGNAHNLPGMGSTMHPAMRLIRRDEFDHWLAQKARQRGVQVMDGVRVQGLTLLEDKVLVHSQAGDFEAKAVVAADGSNGIVRQTILPDQHPFTARLLEVLAEANPASPHPPSSAFFDFAPVPDGIAGYTWDFPAQVHGHLMRNWGIMDNNLLSDLPRPALRLRLEQEMQRNGYSLAGLELQGHPIRCFHPGTRLSRPRLLLAGDAAGSDPLFGEGISLALGYGYLAALELTGAFETGDFNFRHYKRRILLSSLGQTLLFRYYTTQVLYSLHWRWFQQLVWQVLQHLVLAAGWLLVINWARRLR